MKNLKRPGKNAHAEKHLALKQAGIPIVSGLLLLLLVLLNACGTEKTPVYPAMQNTSVFEESDSSDLLPVLVRAEGIQASETDMSAMQSDSADTFNPPDSDTLVIPAEQKLLTFVQFTH